MFVYLSRDFNFFLSLNNLTAKTVEVLLYEGFIALTLASRHVTQKGLTFDVGSGRHMRRFTNE